MGITVNQIAELCGVSRTTVLRALNDQNRVSAETKKRILAVAREHGYRPNLLARSLNKGRTMSIGVITYDVENYVFAQSLGAINDEAKKQGYFLNIALQGRDKESELQQLQELADRRMEGILISPVNQGEDFVRFLKELGIPIVCIGNYVSDDFSTVLIDEYRAARDAVRYIASKNYEHLIFVCPPLADSARQNTYSHTQRASGVRDETDCNRKLTCQFVQSENYLDEVKKHADSINGKTAILCSGDIYALQVMRMLKEQNYEIPDKLGIMGFDNISVLQYVTPHLTTVSTSVVEVATAAVRELISQIENDEFAPKRIILKHTIVDGETI